MNKLSPEEYFFVNFALKGDDFNAVFEEYKAFIKREKITLSFRKFLRNIFLVSLKNFDKSDNLLKLGSEIKKK
jgi:hypothetical protein